MEKLKELDRTLQSELNNKEKTPSGLKKAIEEITKKVLKDKVPVFSWYKCERDDEVEFSGYFDLDEIENIEIAADYQGETVKVYINVDDDYLD